MQIILYVTSEEWTNKESPRCRQRTRLLLYLYTCLAGSQDKISVPIRINVMTEFELNQLLDKVCSEIGEVFCNEDFFGSPFVHFLALYTFSRILYNRKRTITCEFPLGTLSKTCDLLISAFWIPSSNFWLHTFKIRSLVLTGWNHYMTRSVFRGLDIMEPQAGSTRILFMNKYCRRRVILCNILNKLVQIKSH